MPGKPTYVDYATRSAVAVTFFAVVLAACGVGPSPTTSVDQPTPVGATAAASPSTEPSAGATTASGLIGSWRGAHNCARIVDVMTAAGMPEQGLMNIVDAGLLPGISSVDDIADPTHPCAGAIEVQHSHFFTSDGTFGSRDADGQQVDDGEWTLVDGQTVAINGTHFRFEVDGDQLRLAPVSTGTCPDDGEWCREAWKLMVAMPGMAWQRDG